MVVIPHLKMGKPMAQVKPLIIVNRLVCSHRYINRKLVEGYNNDGFFVNCCEEVSKCPEIPGL